MSLFSINGRKNAFCFLKKPSHSIRRKQFLNAPVRLRESCRLKKLGEPRCSICSCQNRICGCFWSEDVVPPDNEDESGTLSDGPVPTSNDNTHFFRNKNFHDIYQIHEKNKSIESPLNVQWILQPKGSLRSSETSFCRSLSVCKDMPNQNHAICGDSKVPSPTESRIQRKKTKDSIVDLRNQKQKDPPHSGKCILRTNKIKARQHKIVTYATEVSGNYGSSIIFKNRGANAVYSVASKMAQRWVEASERSESPDGSNRFALRNTQRRFCLESKAIRRTAQTQTSNLDLDLKSINRAYKKKPMGKDLGKKKSFIIASLTTSRFLNINGKKKSKTDDKGAKPDLQTGTARKRKPQKRTAKKKKLRKEPTLDTTSDLRSRCTQTKSRESRKDQSKTVTSPILIKPRPEVQWQYPEGVPVIVAHKLPARMLEKQLTMIEKRLLSTNEGLGEYSVSFHTPVSLRRRFKTCQTDNTPPKRITHFHRC